MSYNYLPLDRQPTSFKQIQHLLAFNQQVSVTFDAHHRIVACRNYLDQKMADPSAVFYGINTGFGYLQHVRIDNHQLAELQANLLMSHACGLGEEVPAEIVRLMLALKIKSLSYGYSGVHIDTVKRLMDMHNANCLPVVFTQGSLGASGDLAPLSHLSLPLLGLGEVRLAGQRMATAEAFEQLGWHPLHLHSKEGLALINGTQFMSAYGLYNLVQAHRLLDWAEAIAALSFDAFHAVPGPFHPQIHAVRPHPGQEHTAARLRAWLNGSELQQMPKSQVQDPYSFRCIPQVHGASWDVVEHVESIFIREINSVTDNPNVFPEEDLILSGGNFHGQPLALALDYFAMGLSELANISERRTYQLISGQHQLPMFLVKSPGLHSGFMIPQYTAAGLVSENKQLCTPASVDSISSSNNQEDHVSMGANAATKAFRVVQNVERVLAIELMTAAQALDFRRPAQTSPALERLMAAYREVVSFNEADRVLHPDMVATVAFLRTQQAADFLVSS